MCDALGQLFCAGVSGYGGVRVTDIVGEEILGNVFEHLDIVPDYDDLDLDNIYLL